MNILAIETASEACSVALGIGTEVRERFALAPRGHADKVLPWVRELLLESGLALTQLDAIAFSRGPGSFTSLRIGISVVQGLAWGAQVPVVPLSSLLITAQASSLGAARVLVAMDARMGEVFTGLFERNEIGLMQAVAAERVCVPEAVDAPTGDCAGAGNGFERFEPLKQMAGKLAQVETGAWPRAAAMVPLARHWLANHDALPAEQAQPVYLRDHVAEKPAAG